MALILTAVSVERSQHLQFSRSIDTMFDRSDPALAPYERMTRAFGSNEVVLAAYDDPELFTPAGIARLRGLTAELGSLPGIASTTSLASTPLGDSIIDLDDGTLPLGFIPVHVPGTTIQCGEYDGNNGGGGVEGASVIRGRGKRLG